MANDNIWNEQRAKAADKVRASAEKVFNAGVTALAREMDKTMRVAELIDDGKLGQARRIHENNSRWMWLPIYAQNVLYPETS